MFQNYCAAKRADPEETATVAAAPATAAAVAVVVVLVAEPLDCLSGM